MQEDQDAPLLQSLSKNPPKAVVMDYDSTMADRGPDGLSLPVSAQVLKAVLALLRRGVPVVIASSRHYEMSDTPFPMDLKLFVDRLPARLRKSFYISGGVGTELVGFDSTGRPLGMGTTVEILNGKSRRGVPREHRQAARRP